MSKSYVNTKQADEVLEWLAGRKRFVGRVGFLMLPSIWRGMVGEEIAEHTQPLRVSKGVLTLGVDSAAWHQELQFHIPMMIDKLEEKLGTDKIKEIRMKVIDLRKRSEGEGAEFELPDLDDLDRERIEKMAARVTDESLRETIRRAYAKSIQLRKTDAMRKFSKENDDDD